MSSRARFVGRSGEKRFSTLCSDEGITCNPADEDDHGWDHVVQFPYHSRPGLPADLQRSLPPVFVQTKTHDATHGSVRMKLSNALSLARSPNPCFIVVPPQRDAKHEKPWRAVHFWAEMISQTLKRAREATSKGIPENTFHKKWITFKVADHNRRSAEEVLFWIKDAVSAVGVDYAAVKASLLNSVGFDAERLVGTIEFAPIKSIEDLIDHQLGLTAALPIGKFELRDRRFGIEIPMPMPIPTSGGGVATIHALPRECRLRLRGPDGVEIELKGELILSSLPGLPLEKCKARVKADFLDFVQSMSGEATFNLRYNTADERSPIQLEKLLRVVSWAGQGAIDVQVSMNDKRLFGGTADIDPVANRAAFEWLRLMVSPLVDLSSHLTVSIPAISIEDVKAAEVPLAALHGFLSAEEIQVAAHLEVGPTPIKIDHVITYGFADVGSWRFLALTRWKAREQVIDADLWKFKLVDRRVVERYAFEASDELASTAFQADFQRLAQTPEALVMDDNAVAILSQ